MDLPSKTSFSTAENDVFVVRKHHIPPEEPLVSASDYTITQVQKDLKYPSHLIYPSAVFEKDDNDNLRMKTFNGVVALTITQPYSQISDPYSEITHPYSKISGTYSQISGTFGRKLSATIPGMQKRVTSTNTFYLVRKTR